MQIKIDEYLAFGVRHVWLMDPRERRAWSFTSEGNPDIQLPVCELFAELDEMVDLSDN